MKRWYLVLAAVLFAANASAETIKNNLPVCVSEELLNQTSAAIFSKDEQGLDYLMHHGCFALKPGARVSVLERTSTLHIRIYAGDDAVEAWTFVSAVYPEP